MNICSRCPCFIWEPESLKAGLCHGCRSGPPAQVITAKPDPLAGMEATGEQLAEDVVYLTAWANGPYTQTTSVKPVVLRVLDLLSRQSAIILTLAERVKAQSELLSKQAEAVGLTETGYPLE
jgi:hypothetical protein